MRRPGPTVILLIATAAAACTTDSVESTRSASSASGEGTGQRPAADGGIRSDDSFALMSQQYTPRAGQVAATGASAWVRPAPAPAFVASGPMPPADPPAPDPIEAASRRAAAPPARSAAAPRIAPPEAAAPDGPAASDLALRTAGLALFNNYSCGTCHGFADANASGSIGPSLDRNPQLSKEFAVDVITTGRGAMPSFAGQMSDAEIATLADYLAAFTRK
jgi:mono/diheme cytochrome c family protein